ncbi:DUF1611 domain-containing protein [Halogranum rubrum]|uniref:DUF1611 domain-containing protein n=1 Tax=Halogranum salarium B-1 TaxID=1210908 RepID=J3EVD6_9EURY|nr:DUF1611 domain-containing protein [Halogranum salarium]EJN58567.1 hypothetical protein HSB1_30450 [Halogranum salarium B-1]
MSESSRRIAILAHEKFPERAKTATGIIRYSDDDVVAVLDRDSAGDHISDHLSGVQDAPIVDSFEDVDEEVDALVIGIAPIGGGFEDSWRADVRAALERGVDVVAGLHYFLNDDEEFVELANENGAELVDVRKPSDDLTVSQGIADEVDADVVLTVGTDCSVGKMTVSLELMQAARDRGIDAEFIPTGQTGIMIAGWGNPIDRVISDFTAGAVEEMILEKGDDHDVLFVEGQGSIVHPAYSAVTCGILHGAMPDKLVLCHVAGREAIHGYEDTAIPPLSDYIDLYERLAAPVHETGIFAGAINTSSVDDDVEAAAAVDDYSDAIGVPATDPIRFGAEEILDGLGY